MSHGLERWGTALAALALMLATGTAAAQSPPACAAPFDTGHEELQAARGRTAGGEDSRTLYESGAAALLRAVDRCPTHSDAATALNNAAVAYEAVDRFESAGRVWQRIVEQYPDSQFTDTARYRLAYNAYRFLEFEEASNHFAVLAQTARSDDIRRDAILNTATIMTNLRHYEKAATYWRMLARPGVAFDDRGRAEAAFRAAEMVHKSGDWPGAVKQLGAFITEYRGLRAAGPYRVRAAHLLVAYGKRGSSDDYHRALEVVIREFQTSGEKAGGLSAGHAAEARFLLVDRDFQTLGELECGGPAEMQKNRIADGARLVARLEKAYKTVTAYRRPRWTVAALSRTGQAYELYAGCLREGGSDHERQASATLDRAAASYELALRAARQGNIVSRHTKRTRGRLAKLRPKQHPLRRPGRISFDSSGFASGGLLPWPGGEKAAPERGEQ